MSLTGSLLLQSWGSPGGSAGPLFPGLLWTWTEGPGGKSVRLSGLAEGSVGRMRGGGPGREVCQPAAVADTL